MYERYVSVYGASEACYIWSGLGRGNTPGNKMGGADWGGSGTVKSVKEPVQVSARFSIRITISQWALLLLHASDLPRASPDHTIILIENIPVCWFKTEMQVSSFSFKDHLEYRWETDGPWLGSPSSQRRHFDTEPCARSVSSCRVYVKIGGIPLPSVFFLISGTCWRCCSMHKFLIENSKRWILAILGQ